MPLYDITIPLEAALAEWPGDTPFRYLLHMRKSDGETVNLGSFEMSVHMGTHADAPFHFQETGATMADVPLDVYVGPAVVVDVTGKPVIRREDFEALDFSGTPRVLFKTGAWSDHTRFPERIPVMCSDVPVFLRDRGVKLIGLDVPSVDPIDSKDLPNHHALGACGIYILESLDLAGVPAGRYELMALPLRLVGADGAPVRAVLRTA